RYFSRLAGSSEFRDKCLLTNMSGKAISRYRINVRDRLSRKRSRAASLPIQPQPGEFPSQGRQIAFKDTIVHSQQVQALAVVRPDIVMCLQWHGQAQSFLEGAGVNE